MKRHVNVTPVSAEDYLRKEISKNNRLQTDDKLYELLDCFALLNQHGHLSNMETEGEDTSQK